MALWSRGTNESAASSSWLNVSRSVHELFCSVQNFGMKLSWSWFSGFLLTYATAVNFDLLHSTTDWCTDICADCKKYHKFLLSLGQWNIYWSDWQEIFKQAFMVPRGFTLMTLVIFRFFIYCQPAGWQLLLIKMSWKLSDMFCYFVQIPAYVQITFL